MTEQEPMPDEGVPDGLPEWVHEGLALAKKATERPWAAYSYGEKCYAFALVIAALGDSHSYAQVGGWLDPDDYEVEQGEATPDDVPEVIEHIAASERQVGQANFSFIMWLANNFDRLCRALAESERGRKELEDRWDALCDVVVDCYDRAAKAEKEAAFLAEVLDTAAGAAEELIAERDALLRRLDAATKGQGALKAEVERLTEERDEDLAELLGLFIGRGYCYGGEAQIVELSNARVWLQERADAAETEVERLTGLLEGKASSSAEATEDEQ